MAREFVYAVVIFMLLFFFNKTSEAYDHLKLVQQWPASYCNLYTCSRARQPWPVNFTIHGLWPDYDSGRILQGCQTTTIFNGFQSQQAKLLSDLDNKWPDLESSSVDCKKHQSFWLHEWSDHGTCSNYGPYPYFTMALKLKDQFHVLQILQNGGVTHGQQMIDLQNVNHSITTATGGFPRVTCRRNMLLEIAICFDPGGVAIKNCPSPVFSSCGKQPKYVHFP